MVKTLCVDKRHDRALPVGLPERLGVIPEDKLSLKTTSGGMMKSCTSQRTSKMRKENVEYRHFGQGNALSWLASGYGQSNVVMNNVKPSKSWTELMCALFSCSYEHCKHKVCLVGRFQRCGRRSNLIEKAQTRSQEV